MATIKQIVKSITTTQQRVALKRLKRHILSTLNPKAKISIGEMRDLLVDELGIKHGDRIIVSSSFGNLNADFSPQQLIELLMDIVGEDGIIMMPYYPPMNSDEWAKGNHVFDMRNTKSGMGVLTNVFSKMPGVEMSCHPTKAVCVWGKESVVNELIKDHELSKTPFYWDSPYGRLLKIGSKSLCLGLKNIPIFHAFEDTIYQNYDRCYFKEKYHLELIDSDGNSKRISTYVHNGSLITPWVPAGDYVRDLKIHSYRRIRVGHKYVIVCDNTELYERVKEEYGKGHTRER